jgi:hypothetical protein
MRIIKPMTMSKLRSVSTSFWSDPFVEELTPSEKLLYLYLITNEKTNMLGIYEVSFRKISFETGLDIETLKKAFKSFETINKIKYKHNHVFLLNFLKHQKFNTNMKISAIDCYNELPKELKDSQLSINKDDINKGFERLCQGFGILRKVEVEDEVKLEDEKEVKERILNSNIWFELVFMKNRIDLDVGLNLLKQYLDTQELLTGEGNGLNREDDDIKNHFVNWLKIELNKLKPDKNEQLRNITKGIREEYPNL